MNEIEKMYENAGVEKDFEKPAECVKNPYITCNGCMLYDDKKGKCNNKKDYPPFTAEKQIKLIKVLLKNYEGIDINKKINRFNFLVDNATFIGCHHNDKSFEESLAGVINKLWADMSEEEKQQIKGILE